MMNEKEKRETKQINEKKKERNQENSNDHTNNTDEINGKMKWKEKKWRYIYFCGNLSILQHLMRYEATAREIHMCEHCTYGEDV